MSVLLTSMEVLRSTFEVVGSVESGIGACFCSNYPEHFVFDRPHAAAFPFKYLSNESLKVFESIY